MAYNFHFKLDALYLKPITFEFESRTSLEIKWTFCKSNQLYLELGIVEPITQSSFFKWDFIWNASLQSDLRKMTYAVWINTKFRSTLVGRGQPQNANYHFIPNHIPIFPEFMLKPSYHRTVVDTLLEIQSREWRCKFLCAPPPDDLWSGWTQNYFSSCIMYLLNLTPKNILKFISASWRSTNLWAFCRERMRSVLLYTSLSVEWQCNSHLHAYKSSKGNQKTLRYSRMITSGKQHLHYQRSNHSNVLAECMTHSLYANNYFASEHFRVHLKNCFDLTNRNSVLIQKAWKAFFTKIFQNKRLFYVCCKVAQYRFWLKNVQ